MEDLRNLQQQQAELYAVIKFEEDEIGQELTFCTIHTCEQQAFENALRELGKVHPLRGFALRRAVESIYTANLLDTHLTSYEWERFSVQWLTHQDEAVLLIN